MLNQISNLGTKLNAKAQKAITGGKVLNPDDVPNACVTYEINECDMIPSLPGEPQLFYWNGHCCLPVGITQVH